MGRESHFLKEVWVSLFYFFVREWVEPRLLAV